MLTGRHLCNAAFVLFMSFSAGYSSAQMDHEGPAMNYHRVSASLSTGGHFVADGLAELRDEGLQVVIDLRDKPPEGQEERLAKLGIRWINVPVVWKDPKPFDFERFSEVMAENDGYNVLVQCQANYRASAMTYLYRLLVQHVPEDVAANDLNAVWEPDGRWRAYMDDIIASRSKGAQ